MTWMRSGQWLCKSLAPWLIALVFQIGLVRAAAAREISVPVQLDHEFLRRVLLTQMYTAADNTARVWDDGKGCNFLVLSNPRFDTERGLVRIVTDGEARVGTLVGASCLTVLNWTGTIEVLEEPVLDPEAPIIRFRIFDSSLYGADGKKSFTGTLWDWVKTYVHPRLEAITVDLQAPLAELRGLLPIVLPSEEAARTQAMLDSIGLAHVRAGETGLAFNIRFQAPERRQEPPTGIPEPEPTLTAEELERWELAWQQWDAFLVFTAKQAAHDAAMEALRTELLAVLLDSRHDLIEVLAVAAVDNDPVPELFVKAWTRLAPVLRRLQIGLPGEEALRYLSFIAAADALQAIVELGPGAGLDLSANGLRRLARMIAPVAVEDPVAYDVAVDPALRELFGFGPPLEPPSEGLDLSWYDWLVRPAWAASEIERDVLPRLNRWVPPREQIPEYLALVRDLLHHTRDRTLQAEKLQDRYHAIFRWLVPATAWQESCWRQFVRDGGTVKPIMSPVGSVGIMQINQHVWRGFYDVKSLRQDIGYNSRAGSEILVHYLRDYAVAKGEHEKTGNTDNLARATYAVYNGGPGHLSRYRRSKTSKGLRKIDDAFWKKYQRVKAGNEMAVAECFGY
jgi:hypothetical protein